MAGSEALNGEKETLATVAKKSLRHPRELKHSKLRRFFSTADAFRKIAKRQSDSECEIEEQNWIDQRDLPYLYRPGDKSVSLSCFWLSIIRVFFVLLVGTDPVDVNSALILKWVWEEIEWISMLFG